MNDARRKRIAALNINTVLSELEEIRDEEQEAFDAMPESFQEGERGEKMTAIIEGLEEMIEAMTTFTDVEL